eukprot:403338571
MGNQLNCCTDENKLEVSRKSQPVNNKNSNHKNSDQNFVTSILKPQIPKKQTLLSPENKSSQIIQTSQPLITQNQSSIQIFSSGHQRNISDRVVNSNSVKKSSSLFGDQNKKQKGRKLSIFDELTPRSNTDNYSLVSNQSTSQNASQVNQAISNFNNNQYNEIMNQYQNIQQQQPTQLVETQQQMDQIQEDIQNEEQIGNSKKEAVMLLFNVEKNPTCFILEENETAMQASTYQSIDLNNKSEQQFQ